MIRTKIDPDVFLQTWMKFQSAKQVSKALNIDERTVYRIRKRTEKELGRDLPATQSSTSISFEQYRGRIIHEMDSGIVIVFSDAHFWPGERTSAFRGLVKLCKELKPAVVVCNGDAFEGSQISRFQRIGWDKRPTVKQELDACDESLAEIHDAAKGAKFYWPLGNHDARYEIRIANTVPEYEGVPGFTLKDRFPQWMPCWSVWINENTIIKHRFKAGIHAPHNNTMWAGKNMITGHLHSLKVYALTDYNGDRWGVDTGTLSDIFGEKYEGYMEDNPRSWRSGFVVLTFHKGELLWPEVVRKYDEDHIDFRGQVIKI